MNDLDTTSDTTIDDTTTSDVIMDDTTTDDVTTDDTTTSDIITDNTITGDIQLDGSSEPWDVETAEFDDIEYDEEEVGEVDGYELNDSQQQRMNDLAQAYAPEVERVDRLYDDIMSDESLSEEERSNKISGLKEYAEYTRDQMNEEMEKIRQNEVDPEAVQYVREHSADKNYMDGVDIVEAHKNLSDLPPSFTDDGEWSVENAEFADIEDEEELNDSQQQRMTEAANGYVTEVERIERSFDEIQSDDSLTEEEKADKLSGWKEYAETTRDEILEEEDHIRQNKVDQDALKFNRNHPIDKRYLEGNESQEDLLDDVSIETHEMPHEDLTDGVLPETEEIPKEMTHEITHEDLENTEYKYKYINPDLIPSDEEAERLQDLENEKLAKKEALANELKNELGVENVDFSDFDVVVAENVRDSFRDAKKDFPDLSVKYVGSDEKQEAGLRYALEKAERERLEYTMGGVFSEQELDMLARESAFQMIAGTKMGRAGAKAMASSTSIHSNSSELKSFEGITIRDDLVEDGKFFDNEKSASGITRWSPVGCDTAKATIDHELGHEIDKLVGGSDDAVIKQLYGDMVLRKAGREELSGYSETNVKEFIAEAYSEYRNNPEPRDIACKVYNRLVELYQEKNNGGNR
ncbi:MAG: hypothetical protein IJX85_07160 [Lachnospiraceae bacterium]|nr:hypothetical protein [Lachnospiraceae bacterium]